MRGLGQYFARAVVRRVAYVVVAACFGLLLQLCSGSAHAAVNQGEANYLCNADGAKMVAGSPNQWRNPRCVPLSGRRVFEGHIERNFSDGWAETTYGQWVWDEGQTCESLNASAPLGDSGANLAQAPSTCYGGCKVAGTPISGQAGGVTTYGMVNRYYTGDVCSTQNNSNAPIDAKQEVQEQTKEKPPECVGLGSGQTGCMKQNGDYCATASTGKTFCWKPSETGKKTDGDDSQGKTPKGDPVTPPPIPPPDGEWQRTDGHQQTTCVNNTCTTYNVTNYVKVPSGSSKNGTGDNTVDGSGNTSGNGTKPGNDKQGDKDSKDSATDSGNCNASPICVGDTLKCLQLKFTWKIQCNTDRGEVTAGVTCSDGDVPVCAGKSCKSAEYSQVLQAWRTRCGLEKERDAAKADSDRGSADAAGDDEKGEVAKLWASDGKPGPHFDQTRLSIGGGDLLGGNIDIMGTPFTLNAQFYDALSIIKKIVIASAMVAAFVILWRS
ncbi:A coat protein [Xanthomonas vesicatoria]|uniref:A coat protein n=1 Tax=Xanthomonas vesicatoria TaxID=56460 RepID=UPI00073CDFC1|nr:A coat protein [Xanthomonas vesicatoria]KTF34230.1 A coat protein [Xanthomonas vesicatoria]KTF39057.1 A coat protein [Xanthomonas vesicatoria]MCC8558700.1 A coat protein [Xanthomonas vesicatoria]MCC8595651.1 A coat protein [Xanthomonas vesicatoria]MCC8603715.1 A coat protein [Xanthomonas vesicatoria]